MMSGRVWIVRYEGERLSLGPLGRANQAIVTYNGTTWRATVVSRAADGSSVNVELWPVDPHTINPLEWAEELPRPARVIS